jgi:hypothetical protein
MKVEIKNRWDGNIILCGEYESIKDCLEKNKEKDLSSANLRSADLSSADLSFADLSSANLSSANGCRWAMIGPVGQGRRQLTAYHNVTMTVPVITGGCFSGTFAEFCALITGTPWDWAEGTPEQIARWRRECADAADLLELAIAGAVA